MKSLYYYTSLQHKKRNFLLIVKLISFINNRRYVRKDVCSLILIIDYQLVA